MYRRIGEFVSSYPVALVVFWVIVGIAAVATSPRADRVSSDGEFAFLSDEAPSRRAEALFREAFPTSGEKTESNEEKAIDTPVEQDPLGSNVVIVLFRENRPEGISEKDRDFIAYVLVPQLRKIGQSSSSGEESAAVDSIRIVDAEDQVMRGISAPDDKRMGALLTSRDGRATLVVIELNTEFLNRQNSQIISRIEELINSSEIRRQKPFGLALALSGSATVGRDILRAERESVSRTEVITKVLVVVLLLLIYRAPLLALIPILSVGLAVELTLSMLMHLANLNWIGFFSGLEIYVTVVVYGAGVDYCLFLISRYKEELDQGSTFEQAITRSISSVGSALATSAATSILGIGMMGFAEFGKFRQAGFAISFGLFVALLCSLTFMPALLLLFRKWAFWPDVRREELDTSDSWLPSSTLWNRLRDQQLPEAVWNRIAETLHRKPGTIFAVTVLAMMPFAIIGWAQESNLSYGLLSDLPKDEPSVEGAFAIQKHFPAGITGPATVLVKFDDDVLKRSLDGENLTSTVASEKLSQQITDNIAKSLDQIREKDYEIVDVRSQTHPLGRSEVAQTYLDGLSIPERVAKRNYQHRTYTSTKGAHAGQVMRLEFVFSTDPFDRISIRKLAEIEKIVYESIPESLREGVTVLSLGSTAGIRDLKSTTDRDRWRIDVLVVLVVYFLLVLLLRKPAICAYLIVSVVFSYFVTLGVTFVVFYLRAPSAFTGIDWKVPIYLFTILVAMGEDYNILLMARVQEEQAKHGTIRGILVALSKTGNIISSCGLIMAGTFASLMFGSLLAMVQLGFALAFGVLLDTFLVRPILVPTYLVLLHQGRFGMFGKYLGMIPPDSNSDTT
ncbi:MMPL family transporter [Thalassoglobus sp. JC818]|uniref:MMPL family transporter n=1 Tax=Thalassoglobus sp. JC818 TaxID=3232136 RepID=UPI0034584C51